MTSGSVLSLPQRGQQKQQKIVPCAFGGTSQQKSWGGPAGIRHWYSHFPSANFLDTKAVFIELSGGDGADGFAALHVFLPFVPYPPSSLSPNK